MRFSLSAEYNLVYLIGFSKAPKTLTHGTSEGDRLPVLLLASDSIVVAQRRRYCFRRVGQLGLMGTKRIMNEPLKDPTIQLPMLYPWSHRQFDEPQ